MKEALAELLNEYPTVAGRISGDGITCSNAGVLWEDTAVPDISVKAISRQTMPGKVFHAKFDNKAAMSGNFPLLSVKVSHLKDGMMLNVRCSHFCADGNTFYSMMENWASLSRNEGFVRKPVYDDTAVSRALEASEAYGIPAPYGKKAAEALMEREGMFRIRPDVMLRMVWQKTISSTLLLAGGKILFFCWISVIGSYRGRFLLFFLTRRWNYQIHTKCGIEYNYCIRNESFLNSHLRKKLLRTGLFLDRHRGHWIGVVPSINPLRLSLP